MHPLEPWIPLMHIPSSQLCTTAVHPVGSLTRFSRFLLITSRSLNGALSPSALQRPSTASLPIIFLFLPYSTHPHHVSPSSKPTPARSVSFGPVKYGAVRSTAPIARHLRPTSNTRFATGSDDLLLWHPVMGPARVKHITLGEYF
jgi:hypothetical protein